jgi:undecaprenyl diphosphate synthase
MQSTRDRRGNIDARDPLHVAIIMDGNGRWATARNLPRTVGHEAGINAVRQIVEAAPELGVKTLSLFAFSSDNWRRPRAEVTALLRLMRRYLLSETARLAENDVRLAVIGRRDRLPTGLAAAITAAEQATAQGRRLHLRIAVDYSARNAILAAIGACRPGSTPTRESFARLLAGPSGTTAPDVDLLIRSGGEKRLSDFLLWESAYAELHFTDRMWPDFRPEDFAAAIADFRRRERRFGGIGQVLAPASITTLPETAA